MASYSFKLCLRVSSGICTVGTMKSSVLICLSETASFLCKWSISFFFFFCLMLRPERDWAIARACTSYSISGIVKINSEKMCFFPSRFLKKYLLWVSMVLLLWLIFCSSWWSHLLHVCKIIYHCFSSIARWKKGNLYISYIW